MTQNQVIRKVYQEKPVQRIKGNPGYYWVQSSRYKQLWYKVHLTDCQCYCACEFFKYKHEICKHLFKIMELEEKVV